jgi:hypothetical protein
VALVQAQPRSCGAAAGSCATASSIRDLVGCGAPDYEEEAARPRLSSDCRPARRVRVPDTGENASDFASVTPAPRNSASPAVTCAGSPPPSGSASQGAQVDVDVQSLLSISLERSSLSFGQVRTGTVPSPLSEAITVTGNVAAGYSVDVHRSAFTRPTCRCIATTARQAVRLDRACGRARAAIGRARCRPGDPRPPEGQVRR